MANALLAAASVAVSLALLAGVEGALRAAGVGAPDPSRSSRLRDQWIWWPLLEPARMADGTELLRPVDPRLGHQQIRREKPADGLRVVGFGGSATAGLGFSPNATWSRELERILRAAHPERSVEVLNLGSVAFASEQVKQLVAEAAREFDPDLLIVYCGNNEFLEPHAEKYAGATATSLSRVVDGLGELHLYRALRAVVRPPRRDPALPERGLASAELRLSGDDVLERVSLTDAEVEAVLDRYEANLDAMAEAAAAAGVPLLLSSVASNWEWRGRRDLPASWLEARLGELGPASPERLGRAGGRRGARLPGAPRDERHALLFERAAAHAALGETDAARADYRAAMNADPHLRRALDAGNQRVRTVAERQGTGFLDAVGLLSRLAPDGIVGFDEFYDHVHLTPRGTVLVAAGLYTAMREMAIAPEAAGFDLDAFVAARLAAVAHVSADSFAVDEWLGFGFDASGIHDRDLWKYDRLLRALDERIATDPRDLAALVYRGNARYFQRDGGAAAARDWRAAQELAPDDPAIRANLARLAAEGRLEAGAEPLPPVAAPAQRP